MKALTFVPLAAVIYYTEYARWFSYFFASDAAGFIVASFTLFALGVILKRRIITTYLQTSKNNIVLGSIALAVSAGIYIAGTMYSISSPVLPYESLIVFAVAYVLLRSDTRLIRLLWPLFAVLGMAPIAPLLSGPMGVLISGLIVLLGMFGLFDAFLVRSIDNTEENLRLLGLPALILFLGVGYWFAPGEWFLVGIIPISLFLLAAPKIGPKLRFSTVRLSEICPGHIEDEGSGFCSICGRKFTFAKNLTQSGLAGLVIAIIVLGILMTIQIPVLTVNGFGVDESTYSYSGIAYQPIPFAPNGWFFNSTEPISSSNVQDSYAFEEVIAPIYHPERANYTIYYELSHVTSNPPITNSWGSKPGWNFSRVLSQFGSLQGSLITYKSPSATMLVFAGTTSGLFLGGGIFSEYTIGVSIVRAFQGTNVTEDTLIFTNDIQSLFVPSLQDQSSSSSWTIFLYEISGMFNSLASLLAMILTSSIILAGMYYIKASDTNLDSVTRKSSDLDDDSWALYSPLASSPKDERTTLEISKIRSLANHSDIAVEPTGDLLKKLESVHLLMRTLSERGADILLAWKVVRP